MNSFQICTNTSDAVSLYLPQQLFLKPIARLNISLQLPQKKMGKSISNLEVMERLRTTIKPEKFCLLKVTSTNLEFIRFEAEIDDKDKLEKVVDKLDNKTIKLKEFPELLKLRASIWKSNFPSRHNWDTFFRDCKEMNEMKPGERPDTIHISNLPIKWFVLNHLKSGDDLKPSEKIFFRVFEKFGQIRRVDIPICDPYRSKMKVDVSGMQVFDFKEEHFFEAYVQFKDYVAFTKAMNALRDMKLLYKGEDMVYSVNINVDFDRTKHLSDASVRRREIVRDRLVRKEVEREEKERSKIEEEENQLKIERQKEIDKVKAKEQRRQQREEKRKQKILDKLKVKGAHEINEKIAKEEKKLLRVQRKLEAIRLVEELFKRIKIKKEKNMVVNRNDNGDELTRFKNSSELEVLQQREKLYRIIEGRVVLKSILTDGHCKHKCSDTSSSDSSENNQTSSRRKNKANPNVQSFGNIPNAGVTMPVGDWCSYSYPHHVYPTHTHPLTNFPYLPRGRSASRLNNPSTSRGMVGNYSRFQRRPRYRGAYRKQYGLPPEMQQEYFKYFEKFAHEHDDRKERKSNRSSSHSYRRKRSRSRSSSRSYSRRRSYSSRSRSHSRKRSSSRKHRKSRSSSKAKRRTSRSSSYRSIDSTKFISPSRLRIPQSKSWSKSPSPKK